MTSTERLDVWFNAATEVPPAEAETILGRAMVLAQRAADATLAEARAEADRIRREAQADARQLDSLLDSLRSQVATLSDELSWVEAAAASARLEVVAPTRQVVALPTPSPIPERSVQREPEVVAPPAPATPPAVAPQPPRADVRMLGPIPVEAILPMLAIVIVLIVVLAWLG